MQKPRKKKSSPTKKKAAKKVPTKTLKLQEIPEKLYLKTHLIAGEFVHIDDYALRRRLDQGIFRVTPHWHTGVECKGKIDVSSASKIPLSSPLRICPLQRKQWLKIKKFLKNLIFLSN